jgi:hypothetical protein
MAFWSWSKTAASNATADATINWAEGQSPSSVNDSARAMMARTAEYRNDQAGSLLTAGSLTAFTAATSQGFDTTAHLDGMKLKVRFHVASGAAPTLNVDGLGAKPLQVASGTAVGSGVIAANSVWDVTYDNSIPAFILSGVPAQAQDATVATVSLQAGAVTVAKMANMADKSVLANFSGAPAAPSVYALSGASASGSTIAVPFPPPASFKNLSIKVLSNTTVAVAADYVVMTDGTSFITRPINVTINLGTTGINALDTGVIAIDSWYAVHGVSKPDGTTGAICSLSATAPLLPSGYTLAGRIGWVRTIHATATLYGTWQLGRRAQYVVGLAQTANLPLAVGTGTTGSVTVPTYTGFSLANFVPTTASIARVVVSGALAAATSFILAPNANYGARSSVTNPPILCFFNNFGINSLQMSAPCEITLETQNLFYATDSTSAVVAIQGWEDNL